MAKRRVYISGPCSGLPEFNYPAFNREAARLRALGYEVENPAENPEQQSWAGYMRLALRQMLTCDEVVLLPGWQHSLGARTEQHIATLLEMPVRMAAEVVA